MQKISILIVDDSFRMRSAIRSFLADLADQFYECSDGSQALVAYTDHQPDWVLMDIEMSGVDGITATRQITKAFPDARIIMVTGHGDEPLRVAAREAGACGYVLKENLLLIREMLAKRQQ